MGRLCKYKKLTDIFEKPRNGHGRIITKVRVLLQTDNKIRKQFVGLGANANARVLGSIWKGAFGQVQCAENKIENGRNKTQRSKRFTINKIIQIHFQLNDEFGSSLLPNGRCFSFSKTSLNFLIGSSIVQRFYSYFRLSMKFHWWSAFGLVFWSLDWITLVLIEYSRYLLSSFHKFNSFRLIDNQRIQLIFNETKTKIFKYQFLYEIFHIEYMEYWIWCMECRYRIEKFFNLCSKNGTTKFNSYQEINDEVCDVSLWVVWHAYIYHNSNI